ncbi:MAG: hypothetical protein ACM3KL_03435, partial [Alphaproteobacteria bacterium]
MKTVMLVVIALATGLPLLPGANDKVKDPSPDGQFAMLLTRDPQEEGRVKIQLIEISSRKVVLDLALSGSPHDKDCRILWAPDSQRFAFYEASHRGGDTAAYFRNDSGFTESSVPELPGCATAAERKELQNYGVNKFIEADTAPKQWLKSGALVVANAQGWETNNGYLRGCTQTVTIVFDAKHKGSVQHVS